MADRHRVPALDHDPGEARDAEDLERRRWCSPPASLAILGTFLVRSGILDSIHAFGASTLGVPFVVLIGLMIVGSIGLVVVAPRGAALGEPARLAALARGDLPAATTSCSSAMAFVVFWGTFFPLIAEALTGTRRALGPPWFDRTRCRWRSCSCCSPGIGPVIAWRRATAVERAAQLPRCRRAPALGSASCSRPLRRRPQAAGAGDVRARRRSSLGGVGQEFVRGVARAPRDDAARRPRARSCRSCGATAGATAATSSTSAWRCCSSASPRRRPSSTRATCG